MPPCRIASVYFHVRCVDYRSSPKPSMFYAPCACRACNLGKDSHSLSTSRACIEVFLTGSKDHMQYVRVSIEWWRSHKSGRPAGCVHRRVGRRLAAARRMADTATAAAAAAAVSSRSRYGRGAR